MIKKDVNNNIYYYNNSFLIHREGGPAVIGNNGDKFWFIKNKRHRVDGPAIELSSGAVWYFIMDKEYSYKDWLAIKDYPLLW